MKFSRVWNRDQQIEACLCEWQLSLHRPRLLAHLSPMAGTVWLWEQTSGPWSPCIQSQAGFLGLELLLQAQAEKWEGLKDMAVGGTGGWVPQLVGQGFGFQSPGWGLLTPCLESTPLCLLPSHSAECDWITVSTGLGGWFSREPSAACCVHTSVYMCVWCTHVRLSGQRFLRSGSPSPVLQGLCGGSILEA